MEVETGKVLAISNLGRLKSGEYGETQNFAVSDLSEPGSTFQTVSMLIALDRGLCSPQDTVDVGNGMWVVGKRTLRDWTVGKRAGLGRISYAEAMHQSSNVGISNLFTSISRTVRRSMSRVCVVWVFATTSSWRYLGPLNTLLCVCREKEIIGALRLFRGCPMDMRRRSLPFRLWLFTMRLPTEASS